MWYFNRLSLGNCLWQMSQTNCLTLLCRNLCRSMFCLWLKLLEHTSHRKGRSPVCLRKCGFIRPNVVKVFSQYSHLYGRKLPCTCTCRTRVLLYLNVMSQVSQRNGLSHSWLFKCVFSKNSLSNLLLHK